MHSLYFLIYLGYNYLVCECYCIGERTLNSNIAFDSFQGCSLHERVLRGGYIEERIYMSFISFVHKLDICHIRLYEEESEK